MRSRPAAELLEPLSRRIVVDEGVENGQNVPAVFDDALEHGSKSGLARCLTIPLGQRGRGNLNVAAQLVGRMPAEEQAVKKRGLSLREFEIPD